MRGVKRPMNGKISKIKLFIFIMFIMLWVSIPLRLEGVTATLEEGGHVYIKGLDRVFTSISEAINAAKPGDTIYVDSGVYREHIVIDKPLAIIGRGYPVIDGGGRGTIIFINRTNNIVIKGLKLINSGTSYGTEDCGIKIKNSSDVFIIGNILDRVFFGILPKDSTNVWIVNNTISSIPEFSVTERQHGIYAWYTRRLYVVGNKFFLVKDGTYSDHVDMAYIAGNYISDGRYGIHLMYCNNVTINGNYITNTIAGMALMYSYNVTSVNNEIILNRGGWIGEGIFLVETDDVLIENNTIVGNIIGINIRYTPYRPGYFSIVRRNIIAFNYVGITIDAESATELYLNSFIENIRDVSLIGFGMGDNKWFNEELKVGNFWSSHIGYDDDGDGIVDKPFISQDILEDLMDGYSSLRIFLYSPSYLMLEVMKKAVAVNPRVKAVDLYPLVRPPRQLTVNRPLNFTNWAFSATLTLPPILLILYFRRR